MDRDTFIFIAFCLFLVLAGIRIKQRISGKRNHTASGSGKADKKPEGAEPPEIRERRHRRERRVRIFSIVQLIVLGGLMVYMIPALVRDFMYPGRVEMMNLILRCLIFVFTIYIFVLTYLKVFARKHGQSAANKK